MAFKAVSRAGKLYFVPGALPVPPEQGADARDARVEGDVSAITFARTWAEVPLPVPVVVEAPAPAPEAEPAVDASAAAEAPRSERRKAR